MPASDRQLARGRRETNGWGRPSAPTSTKWIAAHALPLAIAGLALLAAALLSVWWLEMDRPAAPAAGAGASGAPAASEMVEAIDQAIASADLRAARMLWHDAYRRARPHREWAEMAALGDAALRVGPSGQRIGEPEARKAYLGALFRARTAESLDGVLRATEGFATLGDRDIVEEGLRIADALTAGSAAPEALAQVAMLRQRLGGQSRAERVPGPSRPASWDAGP